MGTFSEYVIPAADVFRCFKSLKICNECQIVFGIGNTETDSSFEDAFEFTPGYGGERVVFSQYFMRDEEGSCS